MSKLFRYHFVIILAFQLALSNSVPIQNENRTSTNETGKQLDIPNEVIRTALCDTIKKQLHTKEYNFSLSFASTEGETNFVGILYRVLVTTEDHTGNGNNSEWKLILKAAPQNVNRRAMFQAPKIFAQEIYSYDQVLGTLIIQANFVFSYFFNILQNGSKCVLLQILPCLREFEQSKGVIIEENGFTEYPQCYHSVPIEFSECLLLEDLSVRGFRTIDRVNEKYTVEHVRLVMQVLGKFHAVSFALKDQQPDKFKELTSKLSERFIRFDDPFKRVFFNKHAQEIFKVLSNEEDAHLLAKMRKLFERDAIDIAADCLNTELGSVIAHGDVHQNNIMFKYDVSGKPINISLVDWQVSRHSSPIIDIVYFMFCCTTKELRDDHYDDMLKLYHETLSDHIRR